MEQSHLAQYVCMLPYFEIILSNRWESKRARLVVLLAATTVLL